MKVPACRTLAMTTERPPRLPGLPILGNTLALLRDPSGVLVDAYRRLGPTFRLSVLGQHYTVMAGREALEFLTTVGERHFSRATFYERFARELGTDAFVLGLQGERHHRMRRTLRLGFSRQVAAPYVPAMVEAIRNRARQWTVGQTLRVPHLMAEVAFDAYCLVMTGEPHRELFSDALAYSETIMRVGAKVRPAILLYSPRYRRARRHVFALMRRLLDEHRSTAEDPEREFDLLHALLDEARHDTAFSDRDLTASALYGFVGSLVYLNRVLAHLLYEVLKDPQLLQQATREADSCLGAGPVTPQSLRQMRTLRDAYLESLRFRPVALGLPFLVEEDFEFCGSRIRKGDKVVLSPVPVHFSPDVYTCPHRFDHLRCAQPRGEIHAAGAFAPFGFDGRVCAAVGLVEVVTLATIATILHVADLRLDPSDYEMRTTVDPLPGPEPRFSIRLDAHRRPAAVGLANRQTAVATNEEPDVPAEQLRSPAWTGLFSRVATARHPPGAIIVREGDAAEHFFVLIEGQAEVFTGRDPAAGRRLATLGPGDFFGEIGLLRRVPRTATVRATTPVVVLVVDRDAFIGMVTESDLVSAQIADTVRRRITTTRLATALPHLDLDRVRQLLPQVRLSHYPAGAIVIRQGDPSDAFFVVAAGGVEVVHRRPGGREDVVGLLGPGEWFGEAGILLDTPRTATVRVGAESGADVLTLSRADFLSLMGESSATRADVLSMMSRRLAALEAQ